jgi:hypothetical protein
MRLAFQVPIPNMDDFIGEADFFFALAPWQMDPELRQAFVTRFDERTLLGALAWASFAAARRIGSRLGRRPG